MDNTVILKSDHLRVIKQIKRRALRFHLLGALLLAVLLFSGYIYNLGGKIIIASYQTLKHERDSILLKQDLLQILRKKPLTLSNALDIMEAVSTQKAVPIPIILGILEQESNFDPRAISPKGARGQGQLMPIVWKTYGNGTNVHDPLSNITASIGYLTDLKRIYREDWPKILRVYNGGPPNVNNKELDGYVRSVLAKAKLYEVKIVQN